MRRRKAAWGAVLAVAFLMAWAVVAFRGIIITT